MLQSGAGVSAATNYLYPDDGQVDHYVTSSRIGNGIYLDAPYAYMKARFDPETYFFDLRVDNGCYWNNVDGGTSKPASCRTGDVIFWFCPSNANGDFDANYKNNGRCYTTDPASWPSGAGIQDHRFCNGSCGGLGWPLDIPTATNNGMKNIYVIAEMRIAGLNGFRIRSIARNSAGNEVAGLDTRIGLGGQLDQPLSLVQLPLTPGGAENFTVRFRTPCTATTSYQLGWHDADRPPTGIPYDTNINWRLVNTTTGEDRLSVEYAFVTGQSEDSALGGNNVSKTMTVADSSTAGYEMNVASGNRYEFRWANVDQNNGIQVRIPFDEADEDLACPPAPAALDGVKISNSGVDADGSSTPPYGGQCYSAASPANCGSGTLANYPFSDDCVKVDSGSCMTVNSFDTGASITPGNRTISITPSGTANGSWVVQGYSICASGGSCTSAYLTSTGNINSGSSFVHNFVAGARYSMRWIFTLNVICSPATQTVGANQPATITASGGNGTYTWSSPGSATSSVSGNQYTVTYASLGSKTVTVTSNGQPTNCTVLVVGKPFFVARGGDIAAGTPLAGCTGWGTATLTPLLKSWTTTATPNTGAGTNLATFLRGSFIDGVASAQNRTSPSPPIGLSFANTVLFGPLYGGILSDGIIPCPTDYFGEKPSTVTTPPPSNPVSPNALGNGAYYNVGNLTLLPTSFFNVGLSNRPVLYVLGDVFIDGDNNNPGSGFERLIQFASGAVSVDQIPNFYLIVKGNIYIDGAMNKLEGVYIAQPLDDGTKGKIYTCAYPSGATWVAPTTAQLNDSTPAGCKRTLTVNGAFIAKELKLYRSIGDLNASTPTAAETFNTTPATWLATPCAIVIKCGLGGGEPYDAITSLPPVL